MSNDFWVTSEAICQLFSRVTNEWKSLANRITQKSLFTVTNVLFYFLHAILSLGATGRSYRRQDGADAAARYEKFLPARASLRPPISLKFSTE